MILPDGYVRAIETLAHRVRTWFEQVDTERQARFRLGPPEILIAAPLFALPLVAANDPARVMLSALSGVYACAGEDGPTVFMLRVVLEYLGYAGIEHVTLDELGLQSGGLS